jgi:hypothetical protein
MRTPDGKLNSSKNSTKHGLCGNPSKLLPGETQDDYKMVWNTWAAEYDSDSPGTARLLEFLVNDDRMVRFASAAVINAQIALAEAENDPATDPARLDLLNKNLQNKLRYKTQHERSFQRSLRNIEQFGQRREREENTAQRLAIYEHKTTCNLILQLRKQNIDYHTVLPLIRAYLYQGGTDESN